VFGDLDVAAVDLPLVLKVLEPIWTTRTVTATRVRGRVESILDWAATREYRTGDNPARWRGHLENLLAQPGKLTRIQRYPALPYSEIGAFMTKLRARDTMGARALEFAILTAGRSGEVRGARWDEINMAERLWIIPAERMKAGKEHRVPLSDAAIAIVEGMAAARVGELVFPGQRGDRPMETTALPYQLACLGRSDLSVHGFRSSFRDWAAERTSFPEIVAELALAHTVGSAVERAYRRSDLFEQRRRLMDAWARYCGEPAAGGEVVPIRSA
jgi:integrase